MKIILLSFGPKFASPKPNDEVPIINLLAEVENASQDIVFTVSKWPSILIRSGICHFFARTTIKMHFFCNYYILVIKYTSY
jgi:hypothetical protein